MSGIFSIGEKKVRPGVYYRRENVGGVDVVGATNGVGAALFASNWGPLNEVFELDVTMQNNLADWYGSGKGVDVLRELFKGGATTIRAVRVGGDDGAQAAITLKDATDTDALTLTAMYPGKRDFTVSVRSDLATGKRKLIVYDGTEIFEQFTFDEGADEIDGAVAAVKGSRNFIAKAVAGGSGSLKDATQSPMTGGANPTVTTASYESGTDALERVKWNCLCADSDDLAVQYLLQSFVTQSYQTGHLGMVALGGTRTQTLDDRFTLAAAFNDEKVIYLPCGWADGMGVEREGWLAAARLAGMVAGFECNTSLTHNVISGAVRLLEPLTNGEITKGETRGCLMLDRNSDDQVWVDNAINTLVTPDATLDEGWKKIRRTKTRFELMDRVDSTCEKLVGNVNNDADGRQTIMAAAQKVINLMVAEKKLFSGSYIYEDEGNPPAGDQCWFKLAIDDIDSAEKIYLTYQYRFSPESQGA